MSFTELLIFLAVAWTGSKVAEVADEMKVIRKMMERDRGGPPEEKLPVIGDDEVVT